MIRQADANVQRCRQPSLAGAGVPTRPAAYTGRLTLVGLGRFGTLTVSTSTLRLAAACAA